MGNPASWARSPGQNTAVAGVLHTPSFYLALEGFMRFWRAQHTEKLLQAADEALIQGSIEETTLGIDVFKQRDARREPDIGIVLEGQVVLQELDNVALATAMLFGLMYALNPSYPPELKYTFEVLLKVVMELEGTTLSKKAQALKNRLYQ
ncbi:hypothetical protein SRHO_G00193480 [Serrasalmus rhombeus]